MFYTAGMSTSSPPGTNQGPSTPPSVAARSAAASAWAATPLPAPRRPVRRRSPAGRKATLTTEAIVTAAIEVLDEGGVAGLSMRRVAEHLGTGAASLYAHVSGKEELLELVYDALVGQVPLVEPDPATWREQLRQVGEGPDVVQQHHRRDDEAGHEHHHDRAEAVAEDRERTVQQLTH